MHGYAQTCLQLFNQLIELNYSALELGQVHRSYGLTMTLFPGWYRSSGKTFVAHLVSTGSILAAMGEPAPVVAAGLLHAAYTNGDFGDGRSQGGSQVTGLRRRELTQVAGEDVERYVAAYTELAWSAKKIPAIIQQIPTMDALKRKVLLIRIANELEEYLDAGLVYCGEAKRQNYAGHTESQIVECARVLGFPALAAELKAAQEIAARTSIPEVLRPWASTGSFQILPRSCQRSPRVLAAALLRRAKDLLPGILL